ncbi:MAG: phosphate acyltransferase PlsX [Verrucomicrobia bacterium]|nr:phosphate acyltransferase PlsX [Verrucomicrobiota bacterium]
MVTTSGASGRIAVDAMGGDLGPAEVVAAVKLALHQFATLHPNTLVGDEAVLRPQLAQARLDGEPRQSVFHATEVVGTLRLRTMEGVARPALAAICPRQGGHFVLIDAGANPDAKPEHLVHNAILGSHYCRVMLGIKSPKVGLMTIGTEEGKGNALITETNDQLRRVGDVINYAGPIEGFHVFAEHVDVVVCDGFVGNIMIKSWESLVKFFSTMLKEELQSNPLRATGALLSKGAFSALKERINPERYGGAPLLGLNGNILKAHGSSNRQAIKNAIRAANEMIKADMNHRIEADILRANELLAAQPAAT